MARPVNKKQKEAIRQARDSGSTIDEICKAFSLSRNTVFYHLRTDQDGRKRYTDEERRHLAALSADELRAVAAKTGRSFLALQRVANRERKRKREDARTRVILQNHLDFMDVKELKLFGFSEVHVIEAQKALAPFGLALEAPNILRHSKSGKWQPLSLAEQEELLLDAVAFLRGYAEVLKKRWKEKERGK